MPHRQEDSLKLALSAVSEPVGNAGKHTAVKNPLWLDRPVKVTISYTESCNLDCKYCYADCTRQATSRELSYEDWLNFISYLIDQGVISLYFEGGEPLHRPDFIEILRFCSDKVFTMVRTNGTLITPMLAREFKGIGVGSVLVDVMGARAETHDALTGVIGSYERSLAAVSAMLEAGVTTQMLLILNRKNVSELQAYLDLAQDLGVGTIGILRLYPLGRAKYRWSDLALSLDEMTDALDALRPPDGLRVMKSWHPNNANCCWHMAAVNAYGDSIGCAYLREYVNYGNIKDLPFMETWDDPLCVELRSGRVTETCADCANARGSHGGCRSTAFAFHGRFDAPDPFDQNLNQGVDLRVLPDWLLQAHPRPPGASRT